MQLESLFPVDQHERVERADLSESRAHPEASQDGKSRQDPLGQVGTVLGRELELEPGRVDRSRPHPEGVHQAVRRGPRLLDWVAGSAHGGGIDGHCGCSSRANAAPAGRFRLYPRHATLKSATLKKTERESSLVAEATRAVEASGGTGNDRRGRAGRRLVGTVAPGGRGVIGSADDNDQGRGLKGFVADNDPQLARRHDRRSLRRSRPRHRG